MNHVTSFAFCLTNDSLYPFFSLLYYDDEQGKEELESHSK